MRRTRSRSRHVQAVAGLRYDRFAVDFHNNRSGADLTSVDNLVSPRFGVIYKPLDAVSVDANYSLTFVPRAGEQLSPLSDEPGARSREVHKLRGRQQSGHGWRPVADGGDLSPRSHKRRHSGPPDPARSILVDGQRTKGVELGIGGRITQSWSTVGGYAYQDGAITRTLSPSAVTGAVLAELPAHTFSLWNRYDIQSRVGVGVGVIHRSDMFTSTDNIVVLPAATRIDGAVFVTLSRRLRAQINVENLFNDPVRCVRQRATTSRQDRRGRCACR